MTLTELSAAIAALELARNTIWDVSGLSFLQRATLSHAITPLSLVMNDLLEIRAQQSTQ